MPTEPRPIRRATSSAAVSLRRQAAARRAARWVRALSAIALAATGGTIATALTGVSASALSPNVIEYDGPWDQQLNSLWGSVLVHSPVDGRNTYVREGEDIRYDISFTLHPESDTGQLAVNVSGTALDSLSCTKPLPADLQANGPRGLSCTGRHRATAADLARGYVDQVITVTSQGKPWGAFGAGERSLRMPVVAKDAIVAPTLTATLKATEDPARAGYASLFTYAIEVQNKTDLPLGGLTVSSSRLTSLTCPKPVPFDLSTGEKISCHAIARPTAADFAAGGITDTVLVEGTSPAFTPARAEVLAPARGFHIEYAKLVKVVKASGNTDPQPEKGDALLIDAAVTNRSNIALQPGSISVPASLDIAYRDDNYGFGQYQGEDPPSMGFSQGSNLLTGHFHHIVTAADVAAGVYQAGFSVYGSFSDRRYPFYGEAFTDQQHISVPISRAGQGSGTLSPEPAALTLPPGTPQVVKANPPAGTEIIEWWTSDDFGSSWRQVAGAGQASISVTSPANPGGVLLVRPAYSSAGLPFYGPPARISSPGEPGDGTSTYLRPFPPEVNAPDGAAFSLEVSAPSAASLDLTWQVSKDGGSAWAPAGGEITNSGTRILLDGVTTGGKTWLYRVAYERDGQLVGFAPASVTTGRDAGAEKPQPDHFVTTPAWLGIAPGARQWLTIDGQGWGNPNNGITVWQSSTDGGNTWQVVPGSDGKRSIAVTSSVEAVTLYRPQLIQYSQLIRAEVAHVHADLGHHIAPEDSVVPAGSDLTLRADGSVAPPMTNVGPWRVSKDDGATWQTIEGTEHTTTLQLTGINTGGATWLYRAATLSGGDMAEETTIARVRTTGEAGPLPSQSPTPTVTSQPTTQPTSEPTAQPTSEPTAQPTSEPTAQPTSEPTAQPTSEPTAQPTTQPTSEPSGTASPQPTSQPTSEPTGQPGAPEPKVVVLARPNLPGGASSAVPGDTITYSFTLANTGKARAAITGVKAAGLSGELSCLGQLPIELKPGAGVLCFGQRQVTDADLASGTAASGITLATRPALVPEPGVSVSVPVIAARPQPVPGGTPTPAPTGTPAPAQTATPTPVATPTSPVTPAPSASPTGPATASPAPSTPATPTPSGTPGGGPSQQAKAKLVVLINPSYTPYYPRNATTGYAALGHPVSYAITVANTSKVPAEGIRVSGEGLESLSCTRAMPFTLQPGSGILCFASHIVTAAEAEKEAATVSAGASATTPLEQEAFASASVAAGYEVDESGQAPEGGPSQAPTAQPTQEPTAGPTPAGAGALSVNLSAATPRFSSGTSSDVSFLRSTDAQAGSYADGTDITLTYLVKNVGTRYANEITLMDALPAGLVPVPGQNGWQVDGQSVTSRPLTVPGGAMMVLILHAKAAHAGGIDLTGTAPVEGFGTDGEAPSPSATPTPTQSPEPQAEVSWIRQSDLAAGQRDALRPGDIFTVSYLVANRGEKEARDYTLRDQLPAGFGLAGPAGPEWSVTGTDPITVTSGPMAIAPKGSRVLTLQVRVLDQALPGPTPFGTIVAPVATPSAGPSATPTATPSAGPSATPTATPSAGPTAGPGATEVQFTRFVPYPYASEELFRPGETIQLKYWAYSMGVTNAVLRDTLPPGVTPLPTEGYDWQISGRSVSLAVPEATAAGHYRVEVVLQVRLSDTLRPGLTIDGIGTIGDPGVLKPYVDGFDAPATYAVRVDAAGAKPGTIQAVRTTPVREEAPVRPGMETDLRYQVANTGTEKATGIRLTEILPATMQLTQATQPGWQAPSGATIISEPLTIGAGEAVELTLKVKIAASVPAGSLLRNVQYWLYDTSVKKDPGTFTGFHQYSSVPWGETVQPGQLVTLRFVPDGSYNDSIVSQTLPPEVTIQRTEGQPWLYFDASNTVNSIARPVDGNAPGAYLLTVKVNDDVTPGTVISGVGVVGEVQYDGPANVEVRVESGRWTDGSTGCLGHGVDSTFEYTLLATNTSRVAARGVSIVDTLPDGLATGPLPSGMTKEKIGQAERLTIARFDLAPLGSKRWVVPVTLTPGFARADLSRFGLSICQDQGEPDVEYTVALPSGTTRVFAGMTYPLTFTVTNRGTSSAQSVQVSDQFMAGLTFPKAAEEGWILSGSPSGTIASRSDGFELAPGASRTFTLTVGVPDDAGQDTKLLGLAVTPRDSMPLPPSPNPTFDLPICPPAIEDTDCIGCDPQAPATKPVLLNVPDELSGALRIARNAENPYAAVTPGQGIALTYTLTNTSPQEVDGIAVHDQLPAGLTPAAAGAGAGWTVAGQSVTSATISLKPGESLTLRLDATVAEGVRPGASLAGMVTQAALAGQPGAGGVVMAVKVDGPSVAAATPAAGPGWLPITVGSLALALAGVAAFLALRRRAGRA